MRIMFLNDFATCCMVGATSEVAIELHFDEQVVCQDLNGEVSSSLSGMRREERNRCSLTTNQCHQYSYVVESVSCVDLYTVTFRCRR